MTVGITRPIAVNGWSKIQLSRPGGAKLVHFNVMKYAVSWGELVAE